jgi:hypothetical protein
MKNEKNLKYMAIKVKGIKHWLWFETEKVTRDSNNFTGRDGWGKGGNLTDISVHENDIIGEMYSEAPQYSN